MLVDTVTGGGFAGQFTVAAAEILHESVPGGDDSRRLVALQSVHRPRPRFQPPVVSLDRVIRVALDSMHG
jgi:hypothetical protein